MNPYAFSGRSGRVASGIVFISIAALSSWDLSKASAEATQSPGASATSGQSLQEADKTSGADPGKGEAPAQCPPRGIIDYYNLCFGHELNFVMANGMGFTLTPYKGVHCVLLSVTSSKVRVVGPKDEIHGSVGFKIHGEWKFAGATCTLKGQSTLKVSVYGRGEPPCRDKDHLFLTVFESWAPAPIHAECKPVRASGDFHSTPVDVTVPLLGDRGVDLEFWPVNTVIRQEATAGAFSGIFWYEVKAAAGVPSEVEPLPLNKNNR
jgi:hypothetical protein